MGSRTAVTGLRREGPEKTFISVLTREGKEKLTQDNLQETAKQLSESQSRRQGNGARYLGVNEEKARGRSELIH